MVLTTKFYDYLHELEKGGSISRFDMDSPELQELHELASGSFEERRARCIELLERGFNKWECSAKTEFPAVVIEVFRREAKIPRVPHFNYLVNGIFYTDLGAIRRAFRVPTTAKAMEYLNDGRHRAYHLESFRWEQIPIGAKMTDGYGSIHIKTDDDIRSYK